jgi:hypothetical protein
VEAGIALLQCWMPACTQDLRVPFCNTLPRRAAKDAEEASAKKALGGFPRKLLVRQLSVPSKAHATAECMPHADILLATPDALSAADKAKAELKKREEVRLALHWTQLLDSMAAPGQHVQNQQVATTADCFSGSLTPGVWMWCVTAAGTCQDPAGEEGRQQGSTEGEP